MLVTRRILFVIFDQFELLDLSGPSSVFNAAQTIIKHPVYSIHTLSVTGGLVRSRTGIEVNSQTLEGVSVCSTDTILFVGGDGNAISQISMDPNLRAWLAINTPKAERLGSICSGALVLAANGLLEGKKATTHWADLAQLVRDYPNVNVQQDALYSEDSNIWTSAGVTTGIDMALAMLAKDHSSKVMQEIASWLVVYAHRPGHQSQFSELLSAQYQHVFTDIVVWLDSNLHKPLKVRDMAEKSAMTERTFYRKFTDEVGCTPSKFLENRRLFRAKQLLETGGVVKSVSTDVGYQSVLGFRKAFEAKYGLSPSLYKRMHGKKE
ncbi:DJ-1/PfpI family protein [uncultured Paraglaciecola sp.]|uniref:GlxA family transcriptional regulator n=1 Tax=uncultured Paraglaciecola sp. TaxID=1765024 RepID=UPI0030DB768A|tara:strand:+ start:4476 stop:5441 length:966 start_codon:yes stop_codon:yes gene_type:complete